MSDPKQVKNRYVLITAARNEEASIQKSIESVGFQELRPLKWVIVSDGSTDLTDEIVYRYAEEYDFIQLLRLSGDHPRNFASQVNAIRIGYESLHCGNYDFVGNLDADISLGPTYFRCLLQRFEKDPGLGLAGGFIYEKHGGAFKRRLFNSVDSVPHAVQMFRRECFDAIGGYVPLRYGGPDWYAEVSARMKGWRVRAFPELVVYHHRHTGTADGILRYRFRQGLMDFSLGSDPTFEIFKCLRRIRERPYILAGLLRLAGFSWSYCCGEKRSVPEDFVQSLRKEQREKLCSSFLVLVKKFVKT